MAKAEQHPGRKSATETVSRKLKPRERAVKELETQVTTQVRQIIDLLDETGLIVTVKQTDDADGEYSQWILDGFLLRKQLQEAQELLPTEEKTKMTESGGLYNPWAMLFMAIDSVLKQNSPLADDWVTLQPNQRAHLETMLNMTRAMLTYLQTPEGQELITTYFADKKYLFEVMHLRMKERAGLIQIIRPDFTKIPLG